MLRCLRRTAITRSRRLYTYGAPSRTIIDPCTSLVDPRESIRLSGRFSIIESIFENRLSIIGSTSDVLGSIIDHDGAPYQTGRYIAKIAAGGIKATGRGFANFLVKYVYRVWVGRKEALEWKTVETELTVQRNGANRATERNGPWNETERTVLRRF